MGYFLLFLGVVFYFVYPYLKPSKITRYLVPDAYALVTGATDGIGKAIALELASKGFNLVIHGRNKEKLTLVTQEIKAINPACKVVHLMHGEWDLPIGIPLTVLVNNVGVGPIESFVSAREIDSTIDLNVTYPTKLTRHVLPLMHKPALILNVSSYAALMPPPYLAVYAGTKAYNNAFSISLARELENVEVISLIVASVHTASNIKPVTFMRPSAATFAKHVLKIVGCGKKQVIPYWPHAVQIFLVSLLPERWIDRATKAAMEREI
ncbi:SDR family NAD(P)-dependent oxidoreductase [Chitinophaga sp.]|uniref:SDR family NAD(P)-dependent oxidoreductase n=1 Tax=Chitinophaga sp. TaxID=1869181 RepID=UPI0031D63684